MTKTTNSPDLINEEIKKLGELFPQFMSEGKVDIDGLQAYLQNEKVDGEWYTMNRHGKSQAKIIAREPSTATLRPDHTQSKDWDITKNILIEGDNLEVLKLLQNKYYEQVKCIYIDPPYNKDKDFVYRDTWKDSMGNYMRVTGQIDDEGEISTEIEKTGRKHSNWLSMMYPRLYLARKLLKDDGVIFVSIDDDEVHNLRKLMDEIFGEDHVDVIVWRKSGAGRDGKMKNTTTFRKDHEYILVGFKDIVLLNKSFEKPERENEYGNPDNDPRGGYKAGSISKKEEASNPTHKYYYTVTSPSGKTFTRQFEVSEDEFNELNNDGRIYRGKNGDAVPAVKIFQEEKRAVTTSSILFEKEEIGSTMVINDTEATTSKGGKEIDELFKIEGLGESIRPKPSYLIKKLIQIGTKANDIILDFFAGSGTTGHAVMDLNAEDNGSRSCILVQLPELIDSKEIAYKKGYRKISEITRDRLLKAGEKINKGDTGFRFLSLATSNFQDLDPINLKEGETTEEQLFDRIALEYDAFGIKQDRSDNDIIYELLVRYGYSLHSNIKNDDTFKKRYKISDDTIQDKEFFLSLENKVSDEVISEFIKLYHNQSNIIFICKDDAISPSSRLTLANYFPGFTTI